MTSRLRPSASAASCIWLMAHEPRTMVPISPRAIMPFEDSQAVIGLVPDEAVGLLDLVDGAQRLEEVTELVGGHGGAGDREHVAVVLGAHQGGDLTLVVGEALELDVDVRVQLLELSGVPVQGAVLEEVGAPGHD